MGVVAFRTKSGEKVSFKAGKKKRRTRKLSAYNRFVAREMKKRKPGTSPTSAMRAAARAWKKASR